MTEPVGHSDPSGESPRGWKPNDSPSPFFVRHADALYHAVAVQIERGRIDARSEIGDAALDYRQERDEMAQRAQAPLPASVSATREGSQGSTGSVG